MVILLGGCAADSPAPGDEVPEPASPPASPASPASEWPAAELRTGGSFAADLGRGEARAYRIPLEAGTFLRLQVEQDGVDVELRLDGPDGRTLLSADRRLAEHGPELVMTVAERSGEHLLEIRATENHGPGSYRARIEALRPATAVDRRAAATYRRFREAEGAPREEAAAAWAEALATWRELGEAELEGEVLVRMEGNLFMAGDWAGVAALAREALAVFETADEPRWRRLVRSDLAVAQKQLADYDGAGESYREVAEMARAAGDHGAEAAALNGLGQVHRVQGDFQLALTAYERCLELLPKDDRTTRPLALHNLASLYRWHFQDPGRARQLFLEARSLYRPGEERTDAEYDARAAHQLGLLAAEAGRLDEARGYLEEATAVKSALDRCGRATALSSLALLEERAGRPAVADRRMDEAQRVLAGASCAGSEAGLDQVAGELAEMRGDAEAALAAYRRGADRSAVLGDRRRLAEALAGVARADRALGRPSEALEASRRVLALVEETRPTVQREDLRTAFFATAQDQYDLHVALLSVLGRDEEAWATAERARAQALRDLLEEAGAGLRRGADPARVERERTLRHRINELERERERAADRDGERSRDLRRRIDDLVAEVERVRGEIRRDSPAYAALTGSLAGRAPLSLADARALLAGAGDTLLLEYRLGEEESRLWVIGADSFDAFRLPPRAEVERLARLAARWARSLDWRGTPRPLCELSRKVLGPAAPLLGGRRLVLVPDGALEAVPFAALPDPAALARGEVACAEAPYLIEGHEIVHLPSVAALVSQRRLYANRPPAPKWLAVVADPAYGPGRFERLPYAGEEAAVLLAGRPREEVFAARGAHASKATVSSGALAGHRIVHFATHGVFDAEHPLLSRLVLSDGALSAAEIYDLDLPAELVVLSACDTALGRPVRGEGLVAGLPRAFLYAGAERVMVSLWPVQDESTRDLMARFYRGLVDRGLAPGRALQEAQRALLRDGRRPRDWAAFVLQGDWRPLPPFAP